MDRITVRGRVAATSALLLSLCAPTTARAAEPSVACSLTGDVLTVTLTAGDLSGSPVGAEAWITIVDRAGTIGVRSYVPGALTPVDCGGARVRDLATIAVVGSDAVDILRISEEGAGGRSFAFPSSVAFDVDLGDELGTDPFGDLLELVVRPEGGSAAIGDGTFALGAASGSLADAETGVLRIGTTLRRTGAGGVVLDGSGVPDGFDLVLTGGTGADVLRGGPADDVLTGAEGSDLLDGGAGTDALLGGPGRDRCAGGEDVASCETLL